MRHFISVALLCAFAATGCSAVGSAVGGVLSPKPPQVTVVNNLEAHPAPAAAPRAEQPKKQRKSLMEKIGIVTTSTVVGAGLGALAGDALDVDVASTALIGAGVGAAAGVAIAKE